MLGFTSAHRRSSGQHWIDAGTVGLVLLVSLLILPTTEAASPSILTKVPPPYKGTVLPSVTTVVTGCSQAKASVRPFFSLTTGEFGVAGSANSRACSSSPSGEGLVETSLVTELALPSHSGPTTVHIRGKFSATASLLLTPGLCTLRPGRSHYAYCDQVSSVSVYAYAYLINRTSGHATYSSTYFPPTSNSSFNDSSCTGTGCSNVTGGRSGSTLLAFSSSFNFTFRQRAAFAPSDRYAIEIYFSATWAAECATYKAALRGCHAASVMNFATLGQGAKISTILLS